MEYVPEEIKPQWQAAFSADKRVKNKELVHTIHQLYERLSVVKEVGKITIFEKRKRALLILIPLEKEEQIGTATAQLLIVGKPSGEISKEDRETAIEFLSATGKLTKMNQVILQNLFNVSQPTIAKDIANLRDAGRLCPDFTPIKK